MKNSKKYSIVLLAIAVISIQGQINTYFSGWFQRQPPAAIVAPIAPAQIVHYQIFPDPIVPDPIVVTTDMAINMLIKAYSDELNDISAKIKFEKFFRFVYEKEYLLANYMIVKTLIKESSRINQSFSIKLIGLLYEYLNKINDTSELLIEENINSYYKFDEQYLPDTKKILNALANLQIDQIKTIIFIFHLELNTNNY